MDWGDAPPMPFDAPAEEDLAEVLAEPMGEAGERGASARQRSRGREVPLDPGANGGVGVADGADAANPDEPAAKARKQKAGADVVKLLWKMRKPSNKYHVHLEWCEAEGDERIWCNACGHSFGTKSNVREAHWASVGHIAAVARARNKAAEAASRAAEKKQRSIMQSFETAHDAIKEKKIKDQAVTDHRMRVMRAMMERGIPLDVLDNELLELLEEKRDRRLDLGHKSHLARDFMTNQSAEVYRELRAEHKDEQLALAFDSTPWNDDIALVVSRVCTVDFRLRHRLVAVKCFASSLKASNWLNVIDEVLKMLDIDRHNVRVGLTDGCNTMVKTGRDLEEHLERFVALRCLPHFWQKIPGKFAFAEVTSLMAAWNAVFKNSGSARHVFKKITRKRWARKHKIRWNAAHVQCVQLLDHFSELAAIAKMLKERGLCEKSLPTLERLLLQDMSETSELIQTLAVYHDAALPFVKITKFLEGDGFLAPFVSARILRVRTFIVDMNNSIVPAENLLPNVFKVFAKFGAAVNKQAKWATLKQKLQPGFNYVWDVLGKGLVDDEKGKYSTAIYDIAAAFHPPSCVANLRLPTFNLSKLLEDGHVIRLLGKQLCDELKVDFPKLTAASFPFKEEKFNPHTLLDWWREHGHKTGAWAAAARLFVLCQPNSELAERAGAILRARTSDQQGRQLEETFEISSILAFKYAEERKPQKTEK